MLIVITIVWLDTSRTFDMCRRTIDARRRRRHFEQPRCRCTGRIAAQRQLAHSCPAAMFWRVVLNAEKLENVFFSSQRHFFTQLYKENNVQFHFVKIFFFFGSPLHSILFHKLYIIVLYSIYNPLILLVSIMLD
jgi:hypothetical protein